MGTEIRPYEAMPGEADPLGHEVWRAVPGYPDYDVSSFGRARSRRRPDFPQFIGTVGNTGYVMVSLTRAGERPRWKAMHVLVLEAFVGARPEGHHGCHGDGDKANNRLGNLRWDTPSSNRIDVSLHRAPGRYGLVVDQVRAIWSGLLAGESAASLARKHGVCPAAIRAIKTGRNWSHITRELSGFPLASKVEGAPVFVPREIAESKAEIWRPIPGYPAYRASSFGRIETCLHRLQGKGVGRNAYVPGDTWRELLPLRSGTKYLHVVLYRDRIPKRLAIHSLILLAFACPRPPGMFGCHGDDDHENNRADNLRWDTPRNNNLDKSRDRPSSRRLSIGQIAGW